MKLNTLIVLAAMFVAATPAGAAQLSFDDEACSNRVTYDPKKTDKAQLQGTIALLYDERPFVTGSIYQTAADLARANVGALQRQCTALADKRRGLKVLPLPGIEDYRAMLMEDVADSCDLELAAMRGMTNASALRDYKPAASVCSEYIDALEDKIDFEQAWSRTVQNSCRDNADPAGCRRRYDTEAKLPDGAVRKRLFMIGFGWNNCAVKFMRINALEDKRNAMREGLVREFKRRFKVTSKCQHGDLMRVKRPSAAHRVPRSTR
jgi:hypothetical protein